MIRRAFTTSSLIGALAIMGGLLASPGYANESGMFLCGSPSFSGDFWRGVMQIQETGVQVDRRIAAEVAKKVGCPFFASSTLPPIQFVPNELLLTDGSNTGWANVNYYITYSNRDFPPK